MSLQKDLYVDTLTCHKANIGGLVVTGGSTNQDYWEGSFTATSVPNKDPNFRLTPTEVSKSGNSISFSGQTITFNEAGLYMVHWYGGWQGLNTVGERTLYICAPDSSPYTNNSHPAVSTNDAPGCETSGIIKATAGLQIQFLPYQSSGVALGFGPAGVSFPGIHIVRLA